MTHIDDQKKYRPWAEKVIVNIYKYISDNRNKIDYSSYKKSGFYIGSAPVESANKTVLQKRCKGPGMMWDEYNAQYIRPLCTLF